MPKPLKILDWEVEKFGNGITAWGGDGHFEVIHFYSNEKFIIDIVRP